MEKILKLLNSANFQDVLIGAEIVRKTLSEEQILILFENFRIKAWHPRIHYFFINKHCILIGGYRLHLESAFRSEINMPTNWIKI